MTQKDWTPEMVERLRKLFVEDNLSYSNCAEIINKEFGTAYTRNAIASRLSRSKIKRGNVIKRPRRKTVHNKGVKGTGLSKADRIRNRASRENRDKQVPQFEVTVFDSSVFDGQVGQSVSLTDLQDGMCHWPLDTREGVRYCGLPISKVKYCSYHASGTFIKPTRNKMAWIWRY